MVYTVSVFSSPQAAKQSEPTSKAAINAKTDTTLLFILHLSLKPQSFLLLPQIHFRSVNNQSDIYYIMYLLYCQVAIYALHTYLNRAAREIHRRSIRLYLTLFRKIGLPAFNRFCKYFSETSKKICLNKKKETCISLLLSIFKIEILRATLGMIFLSLLEKSDVSKNDNRRRAEWIAVHFSTAPARRGAHSRYGAQPSKRSIAL